MKIPRRRVSLAARCAWLVLSAVPLLRAEPIQTLLSEDFNAMTTGSAPSGWTLENVTGGTATVQAFPSGSDKSVRLSDTSASAPVIVSKWITAPHGVLTVEFDAYTAQTGAFVAAGYLLDAAGNRSASVYFNHTTAEIQCYNGSTVTVVQAYAANTWYRFKYVVNTLTSRYDVYINGVLKKQNLAFRESAYAVSKIQFFSGVPAGTAYFDNVTVQTGGMLKLPTNRAFDDFNAMTTGGAPTGWTLENVTGGTATIANDPSANDKSVLLNDTSTTAPVIISRPITATSGKLTVEFDIKAGQTTADIAAGYVMSSGGNIAVRVYFSATGEIRAYGGGGSVKLMNYAADRWYRLKFVLNTATSYYDVFVDGRLMWWQLYFHQAVTSVAKAQFFVGNTTTGSACVDNVNISAEGELQKALYGTQGGAPTGDKTGGREGYRRLVATPGTTVSTATALVSALASATSGSVVYIADSANIDISGQTLPITVPGGVTLASGRGKIINGAISNGGRIYGNVPGKKIFLVNGDNVRFTGFRLDGLDYAVGTDPYVPAVTTAITTLAWSTTEVDNMEIKGFSYAGVEMNDGIVRHNSILKNRRTGLGYGIVQNTGAASGPGIMIEGNVFDDNRHHIASTGRATNRYTAQYNYSINSIVGHAFDMHGHSSCTCAGDWMKIHHNTFADSSGSVPAIVIREVPISGAYIDNNWFYKSSCGASIQQKDTIAPGGDYGNMFVGANKYGTGSGTIVTGCYTQL